MKAVEWDVIVIGAGPAGLAAAMAAHDAGARVCVIEREDRPGGILKQCIHDGFGLIRFGEKLSGPEYAWKDVEALKQRGIQLYLDTFLLKLDHKDGFQLVLQNSQQGVFQLKSRALIAATGCRERTARQIFIHGDRPAGVYTAGTVQRMINIDGWMPGSNCVILGSGDIGLIMARRLTLEGAKVQGVYELKHEASGLTRNVVQCLDDYHVPLHLGMTVTKVHGRERVEGVTLVQVDKALKPIPGTESFVPCDTLVLSVGLIPENDILDFLAVEIDPKTSGPLVDNLMRTNIPGLFSCGNALHVNDLVDYVSESGEVAGKGAAEFSKESLAPRGKVRVLAGDRVLYTVPQYLDRDGGRTFLYFRSRETLEGVTLEIQGGGEVLVKKKFRVVKPPEMERVELDLAKLPAGIQELRIGFRG